MPLSSHGMSGRVRIRARLALVLVASWLSVTPAKAVTICSGDCSLPGIPIPPAEMISVGATGALVPAPGLVTLSVASGTDFNFTYGGTIILEVPTGGTILHDLVLDAGGMIRLSFDAPIRSSAGTVELCAAGECGPASGDVTPDSLPIGVLLAESVHDIHLSALGDIDLVSVPEPHTITVLGLGMMALVGFRKSSPFCKLLG